MLEKPAQTDPSRRGLLKRVTAVVAGGVAFLSPVVAGMVAMLDPLRRRSGAGEADGEPGGFVKVATLDALPADGVPRRFPVIVKTKRDAWTTYHNVHVGAVYLRRTEDGKVTALNVVCPHAGCFAEFVPRLDGFKCPCHNSEFEATGQKRQIASTGKRTVAPRDLDELEIDLAALADGDVLVKFQNFMAGTHKKVPVA